jgi:hypothetical protein
MTATLILFGSFGLNPDLLYERPPFLNIGLHERAEHLRRLLIGRKHLQSDVDHPLANHRIGERANRPDSDYCWTAKRTHD